MGRDKLQAFRRDDELVIEEAKRNAKSAILHGNRNEARTFFGVILNSMDDLPREGRLEAAEWGVNHSRGFEIQDQFRSKLVQYRSEPSDPEPQRPGTNKAKEWFLHVFRLKPPQRPHQ